MASLSTGVVPELYKCTLSGQLMSDPMLIVETGHLYDRASIAKLDKDSLENYHIEPMADLKLVIEQHICSINNQPEEISEEEHGTNAEVITIAENTLNFDFQSITNRYQTQLEEVKKQSDVVSQSHYQVQGHEDFLRSIIQKIEAGLVGLLEAKDQLKIVDYVCFKNLLEIRGQWVEAGKEVIYACNKCSEVLQELLFKKKRFEIELLKLQSSEEKLGDLRGKVEQVLQQHLDIVPQFNKELDALSSQYTTKVNQIHENEFDLLLSKGQVNNVEVNLQSNQEIKVININRNVDIKKVKITSASKSLVRIKFILTNCNCSITDCDLDGVGLQIVGQGDTNIDIKNIYVANAPRRSLQFYNCNVVNIANGELKHSGHSGISVCSIKYFIIEKVYIQESGYHGIYFCQTTANLSNCIIQNSKKYGIFIENNSRVLGNKVAFKGTNKSGNIYGKLILS